FLKHAGTGRTENAKPENFRTGAGSLDALRGVLQRSRRRRSGSQGGTGSAQEAETQASSRSRTSPDGNECEGGSDARRRYEPASACPARRRFVRETLRRTPASADMDEPNIAGKVSTSSPCGRSAQSQGGGRPRRLG